MAIRFKALVLPLLCLALAGSAHAADYSATPEDRSIQALVKRWAQQEGLAVYWKAHYDLNLRSTIALNHVAELQKANSLNDAVTRLFKVVAQLNADDPEPRHAYFVTLYADTVVVRDASQSADTDSDEDAESDEDV